MSETIYRVQDSEGREPWRPGFSKYWIDSDIGCREQLKPWPEEFGFGILRKALIGQSVGCGCRTLECLWKWFTRHEMDRLHTWGYHIVRMDVDRILAESPDQLVFCRNLPLSEQIEVIE